jgi:hypothetical protein
VPTFLGAYRRVFASPLGSAVTLSEAKGLDVITLLPRCHVRVRSTTFHAVGEAALGGEHVEMVRSAHHDVRSR